jgi:hypothetical protein
LRQLTQLRCFILLCGISCELAGCVHRPTVDSESMHDSRLKPNQTLVSYSLAGLAKLNLLSSMSLKLPPHVSAPCLKAPWPVQKLCIAFTTTCHLISPKPERVKILSCPFLEGFLLLTDYTMSNILYYIKADLSKSQPVSTLLKYTFHN